jgi:hydroxyacylglutathione hydrolase
MIKINQYELGPIENFIYIVYDDQTREALLIDPAWEVNFLKEELKKNNLILTKILLTHGHWDHVKHIPDILKELPVPVYISEKEVPSLTPTYITDTLSDNDIIKFSGYEIKCLHTPGHTPGGLCFHLDTHLFTGDTLFIDGCG